MQMTAVYCCVRILSEAVASLPLQFYRYTDDGGKEKAVEHPLYFLLHDEPNPEMTSFIFRETLMTHLLLWGNAYSHIIRNGKGEVVALYPLMSDRMKVDRDEHGRLYYEYTVYDSDDVDGRKGTNKVGWTVRLQPHDVLHIPGLGFDGLVGYSPIAMAKNAIGLAIATEEYGSKFFANGAAPSGVLEHPGTIKDPSKVRESWQATFGGSGNANKIAVLEEGMKYTPISISPEQAQFLETRKFQIDEIARIFRLPPHMIGDLEKSSFNNIEQQSLEFVKYTLDPWVSRWEQAMVRALLTPDEKKKYFFKFNVDGLLHGDYQSRMNGYATARQNGWMSANDIRELENLDRIPAEQGGDLYLINGNMTKLEDAGIFAADGKGEDYMNNKKVPLGKKGIVSICIDWNEYEHQRAGGLIAGVLSKDNTAVDCDVSAFVVKTRGDKVEYLDGATYDHPSVKDNAIVHHGDNMNIGGEAEQIDIQIDALSEDERIILTLDTLKNKKQLKIGKISMISVIISRDNEEIYRDDFIGAGDRAIKIGKIYHESDDFCFEPDMVGLNGIKEKKDILASILN